MPAVLHFLIFVIFSITFYHSNKELMLLNSGCWRRLLRIPWTARRSNQTILKEINPEHSLEGLRLRLKLQYLGHMVQRADSLEKTLMLGKIEGKRRRGQQRMRWLDSITNLNLSKLQEMVEDRGLQIVKHALATAQ